MIRIVLALLLLCGTAYGQAVDSISGVGAIKPNPTAASGACVPGAHAAAFIARRTGGVDQGSVFCNLINGLDTDSLFAKLDVLYLFATDTSANAVLNLISSSFNATLNGSPAFSANNGYTGVNASSTVYIDSGFNANIAGGSYAQNAAHMSAWSFTGTEISGSGSGGTVIGLVSGATGSRLLPRYFSDNNFYSDVNASVFSTGIANATATGHYLVNRSGASAVQHYKNGASVGSSAETSQGLLSNNTFILAQSNNGTPAFGGGFQIAAVSLGGNLTSGDVTNLYNRICTYLTTIHGSC